MLRQIEWIILMLLNMSSILQHLCWFSILYKNVCFAYKRRADRLENYGRALLGCILGAQVDIRLYAILRTVWIPGCRFSGDSGNDLFS
jgi:preprotein translocase subunit SecY